MLHRCRAPAPQKPTPMHQIRISQNPKSSNMQGEREMNAVTDSALDTSIRVNGKRLWDSLMTMAKIGATKKGGVCRLALSDLDREGRDLIVSWAKEAGCTVKVDQMGNVFMRRAGRNVDAAPVVTGSHADSQPTGGPLDGIYGVLGGPGVISKVNDRGTQN